MLFFFIHVQLYYIEINVDENNWSVVAGKISHLFNRMISIGILCEELSRVRAYGNIHSPLPL